MGNPMAKKPSVKPAAAPKKGPAKPAHSAASLLKRLEAAEARVEELEAVHEELKARINAALEAMHKLTRH